MTHRNASICSVVSQSRLKAGIRGHPVWLSSPEVRPTDGTLQLRLIPAKVWCVLDPGSDYAPGLCPPGLRTNGDDGMASAGI